MRLRRRRLLRCGTMSIGVLAERESSNRPGTLCTFFPPFPVVQSRASYGLFELELILPHRIHRRSPRLWLVRVPASPPLYESTLQCTGYIAFSSSRTFLLHARVVFALRRPVQTNLTVASIPYVVPGEVDLCCSVLSRFYVRDTGPPLRIDLTLFCGAPRVRTLPSVYTADRASVTPKAGGSKGSPLNVTTWLLRALAERSFNP